MFNHPIHLCLSVEPVYSDLVEEVFKTLGCFHFELAQHIFGQSLLDSKYSCFNQLGKCSLYLPENISEGRYCDSILVSLVLLLSQNYGYDEP